MKHLIIGGIGGVVSRTCVAPLERLKILYQGVSVMHRRCINEYHKCINVVSGVYQVCIG